MRSLLKRGGDVFNEVQVGDAQLHAISHVGRRIELPPTVPIMPDEGHHLRTN